MWRFLDPVELADLVQSVYTWRESAVQAEDLVLDYCSQGQVVKKLSELLPDIGVPILAQAFVIKTVSNTSTKQISLSKLMVCTSFELYKNGALHSKIHLIASRSYTYIVLKNLLSLNGLDRPQEMVPYTYVI